MLWIQKHQNTDVELDMVESIILVFMTLKQNHPFSFLQIIARKSAVQCSKTFFKTLPIISDVLSEDMPKCFRKHRNTCVVMDCTEVPVKWKTKCLKYRVSNLHIYRDTHRGYSGLYGCWNWCTNCLDEWWGTSGSIIKMKFWMMKLFKYILPRIDNTCHSWCLMSVSFDVIDVSSPGSPTVRSPFSISQFPPSSLCYWGLNARRLHKNTDRDLNNLAIFIRRPIILSRKH